MTWAMAMLSGSLVLSWTWMLRFTNKMNGHMHTIAAQSALIDELQTRWRNRDNPQRDRELEDNLSMEAHMLPIDIADASMIIAVIDRVPNEDDVFDNEETPVIWMHPRLQRCWALKCREDDTRFWQETTRVAPDGNEAHYMTAFCPDEVYVTAMAIHAPGCNDAAKVIQTGPTPNDQRTAIATLPLSVCAAMDMARGDGDNQWLRIKTGGQPTGRPTLHIVPAPHERRPINLDDEPSGA